MPMDIGFRTPCRQRVDFIGTYTIRSIRITHHNGIVCLGSYGAGIDDAVEIGMYQGQGGAGNVIGNVLFAHLTDRRPQGIYNTDPRSDGVTAEVLEIGWQPGACGDDFGTTCYQGLHTHLEAKWHYGWNTTLENCSNPPSVSYGVTWLDEYYTA
jgi:hypothetical protein